VMVPVRAAVALAAVVLLSTCGLPFPSTLRAPEPRAPVAHVLSFDGLIQPAPPFMGYEIYYYLLGEHEITPDIHNFQDLRDQLTRIAIVDDEYCGSETVPLVDAREIGTTHTVSLHFTFDEQPYLELSWKTESIAVRRGVTDPTDLDRCRLFSVVDGYDPEHADISTDAAEKIASGFVKLVVYAVSYGRDQGHDVYSDVVLVGDQLVYIPGG